ncbi:MAG: hypothetical protein NTZ90_07210 [Proteobacteria bacterium]|nr:hypothetical protein [Pseudomonadota bacterium]
MTTRIVLTDAYNDALSRIEDFIFGVAEDMAALENFWRFHDDALRFIADNPKTPAAHPATGDQSWPFGDGRYRVFFKHVAAQSVVYMTHIIDNRQVNLEIYPGNSLPTYDAD